MFFVVEEHHSMHEQLHTIHITYLKHMHMYWKYTLNSLRDMYWNSAQCCIPFPIWNPFFLITAQGLWLNQGYARSFEAGHRHTLNWLRFLGGKFIEHLGHNLVPLADRRVCSISWSFPQQTLSWSMALGCKSRKLLILFPNQASSVDWEQRIFSWSKALWSQLSTEVHVRSTEHDLIPDRGAKIYTPSIKGKSICLVHDCNASI